MSTRPRQHDHNRARRNVRQQHQRAMSSVGRDESADLWVGYWGANEDMLLQFAKGGFAETIIQHLSNHPNTTSTTLTDALLFAESGWYEQIEERHHFITTMEALISAGADAYALSSEAAAVLPTLQARSLDTELAQATTSPRTGGRL